MGRLRTWLGLALSMLLLAACSHVRPEPRANCAYRALPLKVSANHPARLSAGAATPTFQDELSRLLSGDTGGAVGRPTPREFLVLSGGSQNGAFGGGLAIGLGSLPRYDIVTGVSTGALLSTLIFLSNDAPPTDRVYPRTRPGHPFVPGRSQMDDLGVALSIAEESDLLTTGQSKIYDGLVRGSVGRLDPLRDRLMGFVSPNTLRQIRDAAGQGRKLYVAVTDLDDGLGYAIDLTELAQRIDGPQGGDVAALRTCYVEALIASSSVPISAQPVTLDIGGPAPNRHLFVDGGLRFGVFLRQVAPAFATSAAPPTNVTLVINGRLYSGPWLDDGQPPDRWSAITLATRSVDLVSNQVYRFSVEDVEQFPRHSGELKVAFISNENLATLTDPPEAHRLDGRTCAEWRDEDDDQDSPVEFHPRYMACLLDYGRTRAKVEPWNLRCVDPAECAVARRAATP